MQIVCTSQNNKLPYRNPTFLWHSNQLNIVLFQIQLNEPKYFDLFFQAILLFLKTILQPIGRINNGKERSLDLLVESRFSDDIESFM